MKKIVACALVLALVLSMAGCAVSDRKQSDANNLMNGIQPQKLTNSLNTIGDEDTFSPADFAVRLFQAGINTDENTLISPVSVLYALAMTANGAKGETLAQMEDVLGMTVPQMNAFLKAYMDMLPENEKNKLSIANSIWFADDENFSVEQGFLQTNADYYGSDIYEAAFDDATLKYINMWVEEKTDGMIKNILDSISTDAIMYLVNAMAFDAEWQEIYRETQIRDGIFTTENGEEQTVEMMHSKEHLYLDDGLATGFIKRYADEGYAFAVLLPNEGISVEDYAASLTGEGLASLLAEPTQTTVFATMPKFESEYSVEMSDILIGMGMEDAFDRSTADFSGIGTSTVGNIFISRVLHKTYIAIDERGTKAGAATAVEMGATGAMIEEIKEVVLDRPFMYMIIDCEANLPLFIGTMMSVKGAA